MTRTAIVYVAAACAEIAGCFGIWLWLRHDKSAWFAPASCASLADLSALLTLVRGLNKSAVAALRTGWPGGDQKIDTA